MKNQSSFQFSTSHDPLFLAAATEQGVPSVRFTLGRIAREMRILKTPYQNAVRSFQERFIIQVLISHSCHMGRSAEELGMHRNTLTRIVRELNIDVRQIRRSQVPSPRNRRETVTELRPTIRMSPREDVNYEAS